MCESRGGRRPRGTKLTEITAETFSTRFPRIAAQLGDGDVQALVAALEVRDADAGEAVVAEGTPSSEVFLVVEGALNVTTATPAGDRRLAPVPPGAVFGEVSFLDGGPATASVVSEQGCLVLVLARERFERLREERPAAAAAALREVVASLRARLESAGADAGAPATGASVAEAEPGIDPAAEIELLLSAGADLARDFRDAAERVRERLRVEVGSEANVRDYDVVVIGAGPAAVSYATWIKQDRPETRIALVEKRSAPGFKIGESTLGPVVRAAMSMGIPAPAMRRLFNNKLGLHFWWMGESSPDLHVHVDHVIEETFQIERRVWELLYLTIARRAGIDVFQGTTARIGDSTIHGQPKELVCETASGDVLRFRSPILCDASGPAAVIGRHLGLRRKMADFNTNAYWAYFRKTSPVDLPEFDVAATRHLCFPEGWVWFIELASWQEAGDEQLQALIDHVLDLDLPDTQFPTRFGLAEQFGAPVEHWPVSIGVVPRTDIDTAADLPLEQRFDHYVERYPAFKRIMDRHELIEEPYPGHPSYIAFTEITQYSDRYAGDGWLLIGDAAYFVNPLYSPGLTYGHSLASRAAKDTVNALEQGDFSEAAFAPLDEAARSLYGALVSECEAWYRAFKHPDAYERILLFRVAYFIGLQHQRILQFGGPSALRVMRPMRPMGPPAEPIMNPRYQEVLRRVIDATRDLDARGAEPERTAAVVRAIVDPLIAEVGATEGVQQLHLGQAFETYDDRLERVDSKDGWESLVPTWRCARCDNRNPMEFEACYVCGDPPPPGTRRAPALAAAPAGPPGGPPSRPG